VKTALCATGKIYAGDAFLKATGVMDRYADNWVNARAATCEATHVDGTQSARMLDLRMSCLTQRRDALTTMAAVFADEPIAATSALARPLAAPL
jgi:hypothetical protein